MSTEYIVSGLWGQDNDDDFSANHRSPFLIFALVIALTLWI